jgi:hypothetical protein
MRTPETIGMVAPMTATSTFGFICLACGGWLPAGASRTRVRRCDACVALDAPPRLEHARWQRTLRLRPTEEPTAA